jgi:hypothetical protein
MRRALLVGMTLAPAGCAIHTERSLPACQECRTLADTLGVAAAVYCRRAAPINGHYGRAWVYFGLSFPAAGAPTINHGGAAVSSPTRAVDQDFGFHSRASFCASATCTGADNIPSFHRVFVPARRSQVEPHVRDASLAGRPGPWRTSARGGIAPWRCPARPPCDTSSPQPHSPAARPGRSRTRARACLEPRHHSPRAEGLGWISTRSWMAPIALRLMSRN